MTDPKPIPVRIVLWINDRAHSEVHPTEPALNAVLFDFNPTTNSRVTRIKAMCAAVIQEMIALKGEENTTGPQKRAAAIAITQTEIAQMTAVKALFAKG